jgi:hypothetical protein
LVVRADFVFWAPAQVEPTSVEVIEAAKQATRIGVWRRNVGADLSRGEWRGSGAVQKILKKLKKNYTHENIFSFK